ncbi:hypothetical protein [Clostridium sp. DSM 8431]|uniref:IS1/IS1595 family N-terminal zinc-binding domain-containing protein n=1 Tax=Clostridium sp. DSM 8431 TaxID=1761781 RepID=UPI000B7EF249|nr:hypothetical protein [Clostridium sp. DSM 8431]
MLNFCEESNEFFKILLYERRRKLIKECPHCKSTQFIKYGNYKGIQRYKCKCCKRTFSLTTNSVWYYSKKKVDAWTNFIATMMEKVSLRVAARRLKINLATAFFWRHKIMDAICKENEVFKLEKNVHILCNRVMENHKGSRHIEKNNAKYIWVVTAKAGNDQIISEPISKGLWSYEAFNKIIYSKISEEAVIKGYQNRYVDGVAKWHNKKFKKKEELERDESVEKYRGMYCRWFSSFRGIATKYLKEYLNWFMMFYRERKYYYLGYSREVIKVMKYIKICDIGIE